MSRRPAAALVASLLIAGAVHPAPPHSAGEGAVPAHAAPPLGFAPNVGQSDPGVSFLAHSGATTVFLSAAQTTLAMPGAVVRLSMAGADPAARLEGRDRLPGVENYLRGRDPRGWRTAVPTYATLGAHALYPGVDLAAAAAAPASSTTSSCSPPASIPAWSSSASTAPAPWRATRPAACASPPAAAASSSARRGRSS